MAGDCFLCDLDGFRADSALYAENELVAFGNLENGDALSGSGIIVPKAHRPTVFDLTPEEIAATFELLSEIRPLLEERYNPDGFNVGWNCFGAGGQSVGHAHMHVLLRFADEPKAGRGIRWWLRQPDNRRSDPGAPGHGERGFDLPG